MQAYLIDPFNKTITAVEYSGDYKQIYQHIGADLFTAATFNDFGDSVFVDDEGLFKPDQEFFLVNGYPQPLAGKGLVLGCNDDGDSVEPSITLDQCRALVDWVPHHMLRSFA
jgi:hypothetical protein